MRFTRQTLTLLLATFCLAVIPIYSAHARSTMPIDQDNKKHGDDGGDHKGNHKKKECRDHDRDDGRNDDHDRDHHDSDDRHRKDHDDDDDACGCLHASANGLAIQAPGVTVTPSPLGADLAVSFEGAPGTYVRRSVSLPLS